MLILNALGNREPETVTKVATPLVHAKSLLKTAVLAAVPTIQPVGSLNWHDVMVANLLDRGDLDAQEADDMSLPPAVTNVVEDGITQSWIDLPTFINLSKPTPFAAASFKCALDLQCSSASFSAARLHMNSSREEQQLLCSYSKSTSIGPLFHPNVKMVVREQRWNDTRNYHLSIDASERLS
jgi:hypothetical protein